MKYDLCNASIRNSSFISRLCFIRQAIKKLTDITANKTSKSNINHIYYIIQIVQMTFSCCLSLQTMKNIDQCSQWHNSGLQSKKRPAKIWRQKWQNPLRYTSVLGWEGKCSMFDSFILWKARKPSVNGPQNEVHVLKCALVATMILPCHCRTLKAIL